jgi:hypothetical protein
MDRVTFPQSVVLVGTYTGAATNQRLVIRPPRGRVVTVLAASLTSEGANVYSYPLPSPMVGTWGYTYYGTVGGIEVASRPMVLRVEVGT